MIMDLVKKLSAAALLLFNIYKIIGVLVGAFF
jgi:hypothetical protein